MWPAACAIAFRCAPGVAEPSGPVIALPPRAITTRRVTPATLVGFLLAVKYLSAKDLRSAQLARWTVVADRTLHPADVVPGAVLPADPPLHADGREAERAVQPLARLVGQGHAGDQPPVAARG